MAGSVDLSASDEKLLKRCLSLDIQRAKQECRIFFGFALIMFLALVTSLVVLSNQPSIQMFCVFCGMLINLIAAIFLSAGRFHGLKLVRLIHHQRHVIDQMATASGQCND